MEEKKRHGCVTAWLVYLIVTDSIAAAFYFLMRGFMLEAMQGLMPEKNLVIFGILSIANVVFAIFMLQWKKIGFWGFVLSSVIIVILNLQMKLNISFAIFGLVVALILYAILQIKQNGVSAWENLE